MKGKAVLKSILKSTLPAPAYCLARSMKRLPVMLRKDRSYQIAADFALGHGVAALDHELYIRLPDDALAASIFEAMMFEASGYRETKEFLNLSKGCRSFIDVGASGGYFSALFAKSRPTNYRILSIEPDPPSVSILRDTRSKNLTHDGEWDIDRRGVSDSAGILKALSSGYSVVVVEDALEEEIDNFRRNTIRNRKQLEYLEIEMDTLQNIIDDKSIVPDLIKIDIEGWEHELISSSLDLFRRVKSRLWLELHVAKIELRGYDPQMLCNLLDEIGYVCAGSGRAARDIIRDAHGRDPIRLGLVYRL